MRRLILQIGSVGLILVGISGPVRAAAVAQGIQISPVLQELTVDAGRSYNVTVTVMNVTTADLVFRASVNDFTAADESGRPQVLLDSGNHGTTSVRGWAAPIAPLTLKAKESRAVAVTLNVPRAAEPGGHYGVIRFSGSVPGVAPDQVGQVASVGMLMLIKVNGQVNEQLSLLDLFASKSGHRRSWFESGPVDLTERIYNSGNIHTKPEGFVTVTDWSGKKVATLAVNQSAGNILPQSVRRFDQRLSKRLVIGRFRASLQLAYGSGGQLLSGATTFWIIPYRLIIAIILAIIMMALILRWLIKRYNRRVIQKALKDQRSVSE